MSTSKKRPNVLSDAEYSEDFESDAELKPTPLKRVNAEPTIEQLRNSPMKAKAYLKKLEHENFALREKFKHLNDHLTELLDRVQTKPLPKLQREAPATDKLRIMRQLASLEERERSKLRAACDRISPQTFSRLQSKVQTLNERLRQLTRVNQKLECQLNIGSPKKTAEVSDFTELSTERALLCDKLAKLEKLAARTRQQRDILDEDELQLQERYEKLLTIAMHHNTPLKASKRKTAKLVRAASKFTSRKEYLERLNKLTDASLKHLHIEEQRLHREADALYEQGNSVVAVLKEKQQQMAALSAELEQCKAQAKGTSAEGLAATISIPEQTEEFVFSVKKVPKTRSHRPNIFVKESLLKSKTNEHIHKPKDRALASPLKTKNTHAHIIQAPLPKIVEKNEPPSATSTFTKPNLRFLSKPAFAIEPKEPVQITTPDTRSQPAAVPESIPTVLPRKYEWEEKPIFREEPNFRDELKFKEIPKLKEEPTLKADSKLKEEPENNIKETFKPDSKKDEVSSFLEELKRSTSKPQTDPPQPFKVSSEGSTLFAEPARFDSKPVNDTPDHTGIQSFASHNSRRRRQLSSVTTEVPSSLFERGRDRSHLFQPEPTPDPVQAPKSDPIAELLGLNQQKPDPLAALLGLGPQKPQQESVAALLGLKT